MLKILFFFFRPIWKQLILAALGSATAAALNIVALRLMGFLITESDYDLLLILLGVAICLIGAAAITYYIGGYVTNFFEFRISNYRKELTEKVLNAEYEIVEKKLARIIPVLVFEVSTVGGFGKIVPEFLVAIFQLVVLIGYMFFLAWELTLAVLGIFIIIAIINFSTLSFFKKQERNISQVRVRLHYLLDGLVNGLKDLSLHSVHKRVYANSTIAEPSDKQAFHAVKMFRFSVLINNTTRGIALLGFCLVLVLAAKYYQSNAELLVQFLGLAIYIVPSFNKVSSFFKSLKGVENALEQINELDISFTDASLEQKGEIKKRELNIGEELIRLEEVEYRYEGGDKFKVGPVTVSIKKGDIFLIRGGNGSGKTTLFKMIAGLYKPKKGRLLAYGDAVTASNIMSYRDQFSAVFSDSYVFEYLGYLMKADSLTRGKELAEKLEIDEKISFGKSMQISNTNLSHGQRGRLSLLRALLEDKEIYLFDEWAANQDIHFKEKFYHEILPSLKERGKTIILISHDDKYFSVADHVLDLYYGQVKSLS